MFFEMWKDVNSDSRTADTNQKAEFPRVLFLEKFNIYCQVESWEQFYLFFVGDTKHLLKYLPEFEPSWLLSQLLLQAFKQKLPPFAVLETGLEQSCFQLNLIEVIFIFFYWDVEHFLNNWLVYMPVFIDCSTKY
jgi:hypothetical protein